MANPPHKPTEATKAEVKALASMGIRHEDIAEYIGIDILLNSGDHLKIICKSVIIS